MCRLMSAGSHRHYIHIWRRWSCCFFAIILYGLFAFWGNIKTPYAVKTLSNASLIQCFNQCNKLFMEMFFFRIWWSSSIKVCILWCKSQLIGRFPVMSSKNLVASSCSNCEFQDKPSSASYRFVSSHKLTQIDLLNSTLLELKMSQLHVVKISPHQPHSGSCCIWDQ